MNTQTSQVFIQKNILIQNVQTGLIVTRFMKFQYYAAKRQINLSRALGQLQISGLRVQNCKIFYMDVEKRLCRFLGTYPSKEEMTLGYQYITDDLIRLRIQSNNPSNSNDDCNKQKGIQKQKKRKVKERTIKQAIQSVRAWRQIYNTTDQSGKRINTLESAAQIIGLPKKTLDDYSANIRLAQQLGFDFQTHMYDKIGILRRYVRTYQQINRRNKMMQNDWNPDLFWASDSDDDAHHY